jgi:HK97 family phage major capsid protein
MDLTARQLEELVSASHRREVSVDASTCDAVERTFVVAICSETPCHQVIKIGGKDVEVIETLDCTPASVRLERLNNKGPALFNHEANILVGVFEKAWVDADHVVRGLIRIGPGDFAEQCIQQIKAGVLTKFSIGYTECKYVSEGKDPETGLLRVRAVSFLIFEGSFVTIPADDTVGVNRSLVVNQPVHDTDHSNRNQSKTMDRKVENNKIRGLAEKYQTLVKAGVNLGKLANDFCDDGKTAAEFQEECINVNIAERKLETSTVSVRAPARSRKLALDAVDGAVHNRAITSFNVAFRDATPTIDGSTGLGGEMIPIETMGIVEALQAKSVLLGKGAQVITGAHATIKYPRQTSNFVAGSATKGNALPQSAIATDDVTLNPNRLGFWYDLDKSLLAQVPNVDTWLERKSLEALALKLDNVGINGDATTGIVGLAETQGIGQVTFGNAGLIWSKVTEFFGKVSLANYDYKTCAWALNPLGMAKAMSTQIAATLPMILGPDGKIGGFGAMISNQVGDRVVFGDVSQLVFAIFGDGYSITLDPFTQAPLGKIRVTVDVQADFGVLQPKAFAVSTDSPIGAS